MPNNKLPRLLILGYGRLGRCFFQRYQDRYDIRGVKRTQRGEDTAPLVITPIQSDVLIPHLQWADVLLFCPAPGRSQEDKDGPSSDISVYRETYLGNIAFLLEQLHRNEIHPSSFILISSTGVYPRSLEGPWSEDRVIPLESARQEILLKTEDALKQTNLPYVIFRCGGLYGESRDNFSNLKRRERFLTSEMSDEQISMVHQDDVCAVLDLTIQRRIRNDVFNLVENKGLKRRDLYRWASEQFGIPILEAGPPTPRIVNREIPNARVTAALGYKFRSLADTITTHKECSSIKISKREPG